MGHCAWLEPLTKTGKRKRNRKENEGRSREMDGRKSFVYPFSELSLSLPSCSSCSVPSGAGRRRGRPSISGERACTIHAGTSPSPPKRYPRLLTTTKHRLIARESGTRRCYDEVKLISNLIAARPILRP